VVWWREYAKREDDEHGATAARRARDGFSTKADRA
jgi:hypothetical protein